MILRYLHCWLHLFWQYIVPILALFHGRVVDLPEEAMSATAFATGSEVEHEVRSTFQLLKGLLCEASAGHYDWRNTLFCYRGEVACADKSWSGPTFSEIHMCVLKPLKYVYTCWALYSRCQNEQRSWFWKIACLWDSHRLDCVHLLLLWSCVQHIPSRREDHRRGTTGRFFIRHDTWYVPCFVKVSQHSCSSISVTNKIFGLTLHAFIEGLRAILNKSEQRAAKGDVGCFAHYNHDATNTLP